MTQPVPQVPKPLSRLLVPLDGSRLAEAVLPATEALATHFQASVTLIHVLEERPPTTVHGERHLVNPAEATAYLDAVAGRLRSAGVSAETHVHDAPEGDLAGSLIQHAEEYAPDLIVLCTHGRGGLRDLLFGSIAQQVLKRGARPILLIQPADDVVTGVAPPFDPHQILVPLDAKHVHDAALTFAEALARAFHAALKLVIVVPTLGTLPGERAATGVLLPATTRAILEMDQQQAEDSLARITEPWRTQGLDAQADVLRGDVVPEVLDHAARVHADLIVMTSHGRAGLDALLSGSVTPRITARVGCPLLLVRAPGKEER